jgi:copper chaperone CopZ
MEEQLFKVEGMTCEHCVAAVEREVSGVAGARDVSVVLTSGTLTIRGDGVDPAAVREAVQEAGYQLA